MEKQDVKQTARRGRRDDAGTSGALRIIKTSARADSAPRRRRDDAGTSGALMIIENVR